MSNSAYYLLWLAAGLAIVAIVSAIISRQFKLRLMRRVKAVEMLDALGRYSEWVAAQRAPLLFQGEVQEDSALREVRAIGQQWFPDLAAPAAHIAAAHTRLVEFLSAQQALRLQDPEAWLEADHEAQFLEQWRQHLMAAHLMIEKLRLLSGATEGTARPGTTSPA